MPGEHILPFYVVCDESYSMMDHLVGLNRAIADLHRAVGTDPVLAERTRFCLIGFSGTAEVLLPLSRLSEVTEISALQAQAATCFGAAFTLLRDIIERDIDRLKLESPLVHRPAVFFLSDGQPTDPATWPMAFAALTDRSWSARPNIIAFGVGEADPSTIRRIGTFRAYLSQDGVSTATALHEFAGALTASIVRSGASVSGDGDAVLRIPERVFGFVELESPDPAGAFGD